MTIEIFTIIDYTIFNKWVIIISYNKSRLLLTTKSQKFDVFVINLLDILRFFIKSQAISDSEKKEDAIKNILYIFTHIMEGVSGERLNICQIYCWIYSVNIQFTREFYLQLITNSKNLLK